MSSGTFDFALAIGGAAGQGIATPGDARAGFDHAGPNFEPHTDSLPTGSNPLAVWSGNEALAMGGAAAGVKFYCAYPMSPASCVLHWMAKVGWGSTCRVIAEAVELLRDEGTTANHLPMKWTGPFHADVVADILSRANWVILPTRRGEASIWPAS